MKQFSQALHNETDLISRKALKKLLEDSMYTIVDNPDKYGVDMFLFHKGIHSCNIEVEIKTNWHPKRSFEFDTVNFLRRKEKYCQLPQPTLFIIFNRDLSKYLTINSSVVMSCPLEEVSNKFNKSGEFFRKIPLDKIILDKIYASVEDILNAN